MLVRLLIPFAVMCLLLSCGSESSSGPDKKEDGGIEVPCNAENEGEVVSPVDSDKEYVCKNSSWNVVDSSRHCEDCKGEAISTSSSSSSNNNVILSAESSSSVVAGETRQSSSEQSTESSNGEVGNSSSSVETTEDESSSSEETVESSSSEEASMFLCDDGVTYVLDLANCEVESSSSDGTEESSSSEAAGESSSSEAAGESSSSEATISSSSEKEKESSSSSSLNSVYDAVNNTLTDLRDRQVYKTVVIGIQVWMAQNLNYLPEDTVGTIWAGLSVCGGGRYKSKEGGNCDIYGRLYESDFTTKTENKRVICPDGWSVPTKGQYETMISYLGDRPIEKLVLNDGDLWPDIEGATNESGFSALPSGYYSKSLGYNYLESENTQTASFAIARRYSYEKNQIGFLSDRENIWYSQFEDGLYMAFRCIKD